MRRVKLDLGALRRSSQEESGAALPPRAPLPHADSTEKERAEIDASAACALNSDSATQRLVLQAATLICGGRSWGLHRLALRRAAAHASPGTAERARRAVRRPSWEREGAECSALTAALAAAVSGGASSRASARGQFDAFRVECLVDRTLDAAESSRPRGDSTMVAASPIMLSGVSVERRAIAEARRPLLCMLLAFVRPDLADEAARDRVAVELIQRAGSLGGENLSALDAWWLGALLLWRRDARALLPLGRDVITADGSVDVHNVLRQFAARERSERCRALRQLARPGYTSPHGAGSAQQVAEDEALVGTVVDAWNRNLSPLERCRWWAIIYSISSFPAIEAASSGSGAMVLVQLNVAALPPRELVARLAGAAMATGIRALLGAPESRSGARGRAPSSMLVPLCPRSSLAVTAAPELDASEAGSSARRDGALGSAAAGASAAGVTRSRSSHSRSPGWVDGSTPAGRALRGASRDDARCAAIAHGALEVRWRCVGGDASPRAAAAQASADAFTTPPPSPARRGAEWGSGDGAVAAARWSKWARPGDALNALDAWCGASAALGVRVEIETASARDADSAMAHIAGLAAMAPTATAAELDAVAAGGHESDGAGEMRATVARVAVAERDAALASLARCRKQVDLLRVAACEAQSLRLELAQAREAARAATDAATKLSAQLAAVGEGERKVC